jgi:hypothetical protein
MEYVTQFGDQAAEGRGEDDSVSGTRHSLPQLLPRSRRQALARHLKAPYTSSLSGTLTY